MNYNKVILAGRLAADPIMRETAGGMNVTNFTLAVSDFRGKDAEKKETPSYIDCTVFGVRAEPFVKFHQKGSLALVEGRLRQERWDDKDGQKRTKIQVIVENFELFPKAIAGPVDDYGMPRASELPPEDMPF